MSQYTLSITCEQAEGGARLLSGGLLQLAAAPRLIWLLDILCWCRY